MMDDFCNLFLSPEAHEQGCTTVEVVNIPEDIGVILAAVVRSNTVQVNYKSNIQVVLYRRLTGNYKALISNA